MSDRKRKIETQREIGRVTTSALQTRHHGGPCHTRVSPSSTANAANCGAEMQWQANQTTLTQMGILTPPGGRNNHTTSTTSGTVSIMTTATTTADNEGQEGGELLPEQQELLLHDEEVIKQEVVNEEEQNEQQQQYIFTEVKRTL